MQQDGVVPGADAARADTARAKQGTPRPPSRGSASRAPADQDSEDQSFSGPALSIAGAARGLGVAPATLRSWERRYGLAPSLHTPGGHRRYGPDDLARLQVMHRLVRAGVPAAEAARVAIAAQIPGSPDSAAPFAALLSGEPATGRPADSDLVDPRLPGDPSRPRTPGPDSALAGEVLIEQPAPGPPGAAGEAGGAVASPGSSPGVSAQEEQRRAGRLPPGGGRVLPLPPRAGATARGLARAAIALDAASCERILAASLAAHGTIDTWEELIRPVLGAIGQRWQSAGSGVEIEHLFSAVSAAALAHQAQLRGRARNDSPVLLASVPEELHDLPLRAVQAALAEEGIRAHLLGARTPASALADAMRRLGPPVVVLWAQMAVTELPVLPTMRPAPALIVGGPGINASADGGVHAHSLAEAVSQVRTALAL